MGNRYHFYQMKTADGRMKIVCSTTYAGKTVRGYAICSPDDEFDEVTGNQIALCRCDLKVAEKRVRRAYQCREKADAASYKAATRLNDMCRYYSDACDELVEAQARLEDELKNS